MRKPISFISDESYFGLKEKIKRLRKKNKKLKLERDEKMFDKKLQPKRKLPNPLGFLNKKMAEEIKEKEQTAMAEISPISFIEAASKAIDVAGNAKDDKQKVERLLLIISSMNGELEKLRVLKLQTETIYETAESPILLQEIEALRQENEKLKAEREQIKNLVAK